MEYSTIGVDQNQIPCSSGTSVKIKILIFVLVVLFLGAAVASVLFYLKHRAAQKNLSTSKDDVAKLRETMDEKEAALFKSEAELTKLIQDRNAEIDNLSSVLTEARESKSLTEEELEGMEAELERKMKLLDSTTSSLAETKTQIEDIKKERDALDSDLKGLKGVLSDEQARAAAELEAAKREMGEALSRAEQAKGEALDQAAAELAAAQKEKLRAVAEISAALETARAEKRDAEAQIVAVEARAREAQETLSNQFSEEREKWVAEREGLVSQIKGLGEAAAAAKRAAEVRLAEELEAAKAEAERRLKEADRAAEARLGEALAELEASYKERIGTAQEMRDEADRKIAVLDKRIAEANKAIEDSRAAEREFLSQKTREELEAWSSSDSAVAVPTYDAADAAVEVEGAANFPFVVPSSRVTDIPEGTLMKIRVRGAEGVAGAEKNGLCVGWRMGSVGGLHTMPCDDPDENYETLWKKGPNDTLRSRVPGMAEGETLEVEGATLHVQPPKEVASAETACLGKTDNNDIGGLRMAINAGCGAGWTSILDRRGNLRDPFALNPKFSKDWPTCLGPNKTVDVNNVKRDKLSVVEDVDGDGPSELKTDLHKDCRVQFDVYTSRDLGLKPAVAPEDKQKNACCDALYDHFSATKTGAKNEADLLSSRETCRRTNMWPEYKPDTFVVPPYDNPKTYRHYAHHMRDPCELAQNITK